MRKPKVEFSKALLKQESALIWIMSLSFIVLAFYCIYKGFTGSLPWLAAMVGFPWTAYGVSQAMYYRKSLKENTIGGIKFETVMEEARKLSSQYQNASGFDPSIFASGVDPFATIMNTQSTNSTPQNSPIVVENVNEYQI